MFIPDYLFGTQEFMMFFVVLQLVLPKFLVGYFGYLAGRFLGFLQCSSWTYKQNKRWSNLFSGVLFGCTSVNNIKHWVEVLRVGGPITKYGKQGTYEIEKVINAWSENCPNVMCILGDKDYVADWQKTKTLFQNRKGAQVKPFEVHIFEGMGHLDFLWGDAENNEHLYDKVCKFLACNSNK